MLEGKYYILLTLIILCAFSGCRKDNLKTITYGESVARFDDNYSDKVIEVKKFLLDFEYGYSEAMKNYFPNFKTYDSLSYGRILHDKVILYISNTREMYVDFKREGPPEILVQATDLPIQAAMINQKDVFGKSLINDSLYSREFLANYYDAMPAMFSGQDTTENTYLGMEATAPRVFKVGYGSFIFLQKVRLSYKETYFDIDAGILADIDAFKLQLSKAEKYGRDQAVSDIQYLFFSSEFFKKQAANPVLTSFANDVKLKIKQKDAGLNDDYYVSDFQNDMDTFYLMAKKMRVDSVYAAKVYEFTPGIQNSFWLMPYRNQNDLFIIWCNINLALLLLVTVFKKKIELLTDKVAGAITVPIFWANIQSIYGFHDKVYTLYIIIPCLIGLLAIAMISTEKSSGQWKFRFYS